jgi:hypothetical protein
VNYYEQAAVAESLDLLTRRIMAIPHEQLDVLWREASDADCDFVRFVVARVLGIGCSDVLRMERAAGKTGLFAYLYAAPSLHVMQIHDTVIIDRAWP